jgi:hypothetical protein
MDENLIQLTTSQKFEVEKVNRIIDNTNNLDDLRRLAKLLFESWQIQKAAIIWSMKQSLPPPLTKRLPNS